MRRLMEGVFVTKIIKTYVLPLLIVAGAGLSLWSSQYEAPVFWYQPVVSTVDKPVLYQENLIPNAETPTMHSVSVADCTNGDLLAVWYGGTREGHVDVALYSARYDVKNGQWQAPKKILDRYQVANDTHHYIKKLGNPVLVNHPSGVMALVYVSVSLGGWATSQINMMLSYDEGQTWHASKQLKVTPFINISTLVKNDAVIYQDGSIGITAYQELIGEFSEIIRVNLDGTVINKYRMSDGDYTIQPSVVVQGPMKAVTLMRDSSRHTQKVQITSTDDGGYSWQPYESLPIDNPNSAIYGFEDSQARIWMVFNNATRDRDVEHEARANLALAYRNTEHEDWKIVHYFEQPETQEQETHRYSYPWVHQSAAGEIHLLYTENRHQFKHVMFNEAWLETLL